MKIRFYCLLATSGLFLLFTGPVSATPNRYSFTDSPTEVQRKVAAREKVATDKKATKLKKNSSRRTKKMTAGLGRAMLVALGLEESKRVTSPLNRDRQLHRHQQLLKMKARQESRAHRARCRRQLK